MRATKRPDRLVRIGGAALGACLALALIVVARPAGGHGGVLPAALAFTARQSGTISVTPASPRVVARDATMRPGDAVGGSLRMDNQSGDALELGVRAAPSSTELDGIVRLRLTAGRRTLADTTLQGLRHGSASTLRVAPGAGARLRLRAWIPAATETGYEGRHVDVTLVPTVMPG